MLEMYFTPGPDSIPASIVVSITLLSVFAVPTVYYYFTRPKFDFYDAYVKISRARASVDVPYSQITLDWETDRKGRNWCVLNSDQTGASQRKSWRLLNVIVPKAGTTTFLFLKEKTGLASAQELEEAKPEVERLVRRAKKFRKTMSLVSGIGAAFTIVGGILIWNPLRIHVSSSIGIMIFASFALGPILFLIGIFAILRTL